MRIVAGLDFETTGTDREKDRAIEAGAALFDADNGWEVLDTFNALILDESYLPLPEKIPVLTGISEQMLREQGRPLADVMKDLLHFVGRGQYLMAHNASFDRAFFDREREAVGMGEPQIPPSLWLCTLHHIPYHWKYTCRKLSHLAFEHGCQVDVKNLHRATDDVVLMGDLLRTGGYTLDEMLRYRDEPWVYIQAHVTPPWKDKGESKAEAQAHGFSWQQCAGRVGPVFDTMWVKRVKKSALDEEKKKETLLFKRTILCEQVEY